MEYIHVDMVREHLDDIPQYSPPSGYRMRLFTPGDKATWQRIWHEAETVRPIRPDTFDRNFGGDLPAMPRRCFFLVAPDGRDVGTITSWYERRHYGRPWGRIHWLAITPEHRGRRLSRCMMTAAMNRLRALGHRRALLGTQTVRIAAIRLYLRFGFVPDMRTKDAARAWGLVGRRISHPALGAVR